MRNGKIMLWYINNIVNVFVVRFQIFDILEALRTYVAGVFLGYVVDQYHMFAQIARSFIRR